MLRARFGDLPGAAILSPAFSGSAGIINSGRKGLKCHWSEIFYFIFKLYKPSLVKLPIHLVGDNGSFIRFWSFSAWYQPAKMGGSATPPWCHWVCTEWILQHRAMCHFWLWLKELLFPLFLLLFPIEDRLNKMTQSTLRLLDRIKTNRWPGKTQELRRPTGRKWPLSTNPVGQIRKYCDCGVLESVVLILFHSIRVLSEDISVVNLRMLVPHLRCVNILF